MGKDRVEGEKHTRETEEAYFEILHRPGKQSIIQMAEKEREGLLTVGFEDEDLRALRDLLNELNLSEGE